jgi:hypothetical protein
LPVENPPFDPLFFKPNAARRHAPAKAIRLRDKEHYKYVARQPCVICGRTPAEAIISGSHSLARWGAKSATNTRSPSAGSITANCMATAMRPHGGPVLASIRCPLRSNFGRDRGQWKACDEAISHSPPKRILTR